MQRLDDYWYSRHPVVYLLLPLSLIFWIVSSLRRWCYRAGICKVWRCAVPVVVVGNITVGGTGKTPLVIWLVEYLTELGWKPGVVARGYGGRAERSPQRVTADSEPGRVGDEPVSIVQRTHCPVYVAPDRPAAVRALLRDTDCDIVVSDDGLQHYALDRDIEIAVIDGRRRFGNGLLLPAGPLRESRRRLRTVDLTIVNGEAREHELHMSIGRPGLRPLLPGRASSAITGLAGQPVHAVAGIGDPRRFFDLLRSYNLRVIEHAFPDHHALRPDDIVFADRFPVLMTEKDAVKCARFAGPEHWVVQVSATPDDHFIERLNSLLKAV